MSKDIKLPMLQEATEYAFRVHKRQFRKGTGIPYQFHLSDVTGRVAHYMLHLDESILDDMTVDELLAASMLHDTIEDCNISFDLVKKKFGKNVSKVVLECSRIQGHESKPQKYKFLESFDKKSTASLLIKIADRYVNVNDYHRTPNKLKYASTYALQAYPLYQAFIKRAQEGKFENTEIVFADLQNLQAIITKVFNVNIAQSGQDEFVKELVT
jgi:(p)ppGpp synthase/HD superfamily hydrolase